jgi:hypothetical protein
MTIPLSLHDYANVTFSSSLPEPLVECQDNSPSGSKTNPNLPILTKLALVSFVGLFFAHTLSLSCFDLTRTCVAFLFSAFFFPFVRPLRWLIKMVLRISFWASLYILSSTVHTYQLTYRLATSLLRDARRNSKENGGRLFLTQVFIGLIASFAIVSGFPLLHIATTLYKIALYTFRLLRAFVLLQYYMVLLASLEFMIYLRIDRVIGILGAAWFRWAVYRVCSVLTWVDIVVRFPPFSTPNT